MKNDKKAKKQEKLAKFLAKQKKPVKVAQKVEKVTINAGYNPTSTESGWNDFWQVNGFFKPEFNEIVECFCDLKIDYSMVHNKIDIETINKNNHGSYFMDILKLRDVKREEYENCQKSHNKNELTLNDPKIKKEFLNDVISLDSDHIPKSPQNLNSQSLNDNSALRSDSIHRNSSFDKSHTKNGQSLNNNSALRSDSIHRDYSLESLNSENCQVISDNKGQSPPNVSSYDPQKHLTGKSQQSSKSHCENLPPMCAKCGRMKRVLSKRPYVIPLPPPNITGKLHIGHGLMLSIQDALARYYRMHGRPVLFLPGTDHAGIATQTVVEKKIAKFTTRFELGREKFIQEVDNWKNFHGSIIYDQMQRLGASFDLSRQRFTLDDGYSLSVLDAFNVLYERGKIYRDSKIVSYSAKLQTTLSDLEVVPREIMPFEKVSVDGGTYTFGVMHYFKYPIVPIKYPGMSLSKCKNSENDKNFHSNDNLDGQNEDSNRSAEECKNSENDKNFHSNDNSDCKNVDNNPNAECGVKSEIGSLTTHECISQQHMKLMIDLKSPLFRMGNIFQGATIPENFEINHSMKSDTSKLNPIEKNDVSLSLDSGSFPNKNAFISTSARENLLVNCNTHYDQNIDSNLAVKDSSLVSLNDSHFYTGNLQTLPFLEIGTTRIETILGDTAICLNPNDPRKLLLQNCFAVNPLTRKLIPIVYDNACEIDFGSSALKVTPAHDFNDFDIGKRNSLSQVVIFDPQNSIVLDDILKDFSSVDFAENINSPIGDSRVHEKASCHENYDFSSIDFGENNGSPIRESRVYEKASCHEKNEPFEKSTKSRGQGDLISSIKNLDIKNNAYNIKLSALFEMLRKELFPLKGLKRFEARLRVISFLKNHDLFLRETGHSMTIPICSRSGDIVEPSVKKQWFMDCKDLAKQALSLKNLKIHPIEAFKTWKNWLVNIKDWCLSRQLWYGHRIPAFRLFCGDKRIGWVVGCSTSLVFYNSLKVIEDVFDSSFKQKGSLSGQLNLKNCVEPINNDKNHQPHSETTENGLESGNNSELKQNENHVIHSESEINQVSRLYIKTEEKDQFKLNAKLKSDKSHNDYSESEKQVTKSDLLCTDNGNMLEDTSTKSASNRNFNNLFKNYTQKSQTRFSFDFEFKQNTVKVHCDKKLDELSSVIYFDLFGKTFSLYQDEDVLDTWFSSGLWPFATVGWRSDHILENKSVNDHLTCKESTNNFSNLESQSGVQEPDRPLSCKESPRNSPDLESHPKLKEHKHRFLENRSLDFSKYFPASILETGYDILFFWVARMVMMSLELTGKAPFSEILLHGIIRDAHGKKMSKSLGNVIDPLYIINGITLCEMNDVLVDTHKNGYISQKELQRAMDAQKKDFPNGISQCGADALRFALCSYFMNMKDINLDIKRVFGYRKLCNKIYNSHKFYEHLLNSQIDSLNRNDSENGNTELPVDRDGVSRNMIIREKNTPERVVSGDISFLQDGILNPESEGKMSPNKNDSNMNQSHIEKGSRDVILLDENRSLMQTELLPRKNNVEHSDCPIYIENEEFHLTNKAHNSILHILWIIHRRNECLIAYKTNFEIYNFMQATQSIHHLFLNDFCDIFIETIKKTKNLVDLNTFNSIFKDILAMFSPFMPFISEEIYQKIRGPFDAPSLCVYDFPQIVNVSDYFGKNVLGENSIHTFKINLESFSSSERQNAVSKASNEDFLEKLGANKNFYEKKPSLNDSEGYKVLPQERGDLKNNPFIKMDHKQKTNNLHQKNDLLIIDQYSQVSNHDIDKNSQIILESTHFKTLELTSNKNKGSGSKTNSDLDFIAPTSLQDDKKEKSLHEINNGYNSHTITPTALQDDKKEKSLYETKECLQSSTDVQKNGGKTFINNEDIQNAIKKFENIIDLIKTIRSLCEVNKIRKFTLEITTQDSQILFYIQKILRNMTKIEIVKSVKSKLKAHCGEIHFGVSESK